MVSWEGVCVVTGRGCVCRELAAKRQETQALVQEMECTAEAFEEVQEQNMRLLLQIREKDDANFKVCRYSVGR